MVKLEAHFEHDKAGWDHCLSRSEGLDFANVEEGLT